MRNKKGLTLVELIAVIAIIAILFVLLIPSISSAMEKARVSGVQTDLRSYQISLESYLMSNIDSEIKEENINNHLDKNLQFTGGESKEKSPWNTPYELKIDGEEISIYSTNKEKEPKLFGIHYKKENGHYVSEQVGFDEVQTADNRPKCVKNANPASDFEITEISGGITITDYIGATKEVVIPCEINEKQVVAIAKTTSSAKKSFFEKNLTSVTIPNTVTTIGDYAFYNNELTNVIIPNSVTKIGISAFVNNKLTSVTISNSVASIEPYTFENNELASVTIPNSVTSIGASAFDGNELTSVTIPNSVTNIGAWAFNDNKLTSVTIPNSVTSIGSKGFYLNPDLKNVTNCSYLEIMDKFDSSPAFNTTGCN